MQIIAYMYNLNKIITKSWRWVLLYILIVMQAKIEFKHKSKFQGQVENMLKASINFGQALALNLLIS